MLFDTPLLFSDDAATGALSASCITRETTSGCY